jgi:hypothetical protein
MEEMRKSWEIVFQKTAGERSIGYRPTLESNFRTTSFRNKMWRGRLDLTGSG